MLNLYIPILSLKVPCNLKDFRHDIDTGRNDSKRFDLQNGGLNLLNWGVKMMMIKMKSQIKME